ncbi:MAG: hypothetical protein RIC55_16755 [Pirellulaceae bacterium]
MAVAVRRLLFCSVLLSFAGSISDAFGAEIEILALRDFDDVELKFNGMRRTAFLVGLAPLDASDLDAAERKRRLRAVGELLKRCDLVVTVVVQEEDRLGVALNAYAHRRHGFEHPWNPSKYPWCATNWGAYNLNLYFLHQGWADFQDNFDIDNHQRWKPHFEKLRP